jgi:septal ring factor EnvC (AmiA/AmiB activator)
LAEKNRLFQEISEKTKALQGEIARLRDQEDNLNQALVEKDEQLEEFRVREEEHRQVEELLKRREEELREQVRTLEEALAEKDKTLERLRIRGKRPGQKRKRFGNGPETGHQGRRVERPAAFGGSAPEADGATEQLGK